MSGKNLKIMNKRIFMRRGVTKGFSRCLLGRVEKNPHILTSTSKKVELCCFSLSFKGRKRCFSAKSGERQEKVNNKDNPTDENYLPYDHYDIVVVGGGMVGNSFACSLASRPITRSMKVAVLEAGVVKPFQEVHDWPCLRVSAVSPESVKILQENGGWNYLSKHRVKAYNEMQVWDWFARGKLHWKASDLHSMHWGSDASPPSELGYLIENENIQSALSNALVDLSGVSGCGTELYKTKVVNIDTNEKPILSPKQIESEDTSDWVSITLENGNVLKSRLVVGADGANSFVKKSLGIGSWGWDYNQSGVVCSLKLDSPSNTAWQRFLPDGPLALLPAYDDYASIVWSTTASHAAHICSLKPDEVVEEINNALRAPTEEWLPGKQDTIFSHILPSKFRQHLDTLLESSNSPDPPIIVEAMNKPQSFPFRFIQSNSYVAHRTALIGDAAHVIHPLAGQGVNLGFDDAQQLADIVEEAVKSGQDIGSINILEAYSRRQKCYDLSVLMGCDAVQKLYSFKSGPVPLIRNVGMDFLNSFPFLKNSLARFAMGYRDFNKVFNG